MVGLCLGVLCLGRLVVFSVLRRRVTFANVGVVVALVFAMSGGAYAASKFLITSTKQISPKVLKSLKGSTGPAGPAGPTGVTGPAGPAGVAGPAGSAGGKCEKGEAGSNGVSVASVESKSKVGPCKEGGSEFRSAGGTTYACNGEKGAPGAPGKNGTFGDEPLPAGKSLIGTWGGSGYSGVELSFATIEEAGRVQVNVSFPEPVSPAIALSNTEYIGVGEGEKQANESLAIKEGKCKGTAEEPAAEEGYLCVFAEEESNLYTGHPVIGLPLVSGMSVGFDLNQYIAKKGRSVLFGVWVVTG
jgi:hypothetical protein